MHVLTRTGDLLICHSFPLISRYLAGDASDSDSGEDSADDDDDEPEENSNTKSQSREDEKFDESKYRKKDDALKAKFTERFRILKETNPEILPVYPNTKQKPAQQQAEQPKDAAEFTCQEPGCGKICSSSRGLKNHARKHRRGGRRTTATINFMLFLKNPIFLRKLPLIKLQIY